MPSKSEDVWEKALREVPDKPDRFMRRRKRFMEKTDAEDDAQNYDAAMGGMAAAGAYLGQRLLRRVVRGKPHYAESPNIATKALIAGTAGSIANQSRGIYERDEQRDKKKSRRK